MVATVLQELKSAYEARPFRPFKVVLDDGTELLVKQPEFIGWSTSARRLVWANPQDTFDQFDLARLVAVRPAGRNLSGRRKPTKKRRGRRGP